MRSLEEEIVINQFGQGVYSIADLLDQFSQLDRAQKRKLFLDLYFLVSDLSMTESDLEQALANCSLKPTDAVYTYLHLDRLNTGLKGVLFVPSTANPPDGTFDKSYFVLLHLFKANYQRRYAVEKENPTKWWYWDLSNSETAQGILTRHQALVDEVYNAPGYRSEFATLAKVWHDNHFPTQANPSGPAPEPQTKFDFVTYDEMLTKSVMLFNFKQMHGIALLRNSLENALLLHYNIDTEQARRLVLDVIERHMQETYGTGIF